MSVAVDFRRELELAMKDEDGVFTALTALMTRMRRFLIETPSA